MNKTHRRISLRGNSILVAVCLVSLLSNAFSNTVTAKSGSRADIQNAINAAPEHGTVIIPKGVHTIQGGSLQVKKSVTISGSGKKDTELRRGSGLTWLFQAIADGFVRITNLVLDGNKGGGGIRFRSDNLEMRVDNNTLRNFGTRAVETNGNIKGVIDNNLFQENKITDVVVYGDNEASWKRPLSLGSDDAVYVEDNVFTHEKVRGAAHSIASNHGSRYVFRYNTIRDGNLNTNPIDAHGNFEYGRGSRSYEIYGNKIHSAQSFQGMYIRGGTGVIFDNEFTGKFTHPIVLEDYRSFNKTRSGRYYSETYPSIDQISDLHIWNNGYGQSTVGAHIRDRGLTRKHIQNGRDFFLKQKSGYKPFTYPHPLTKKSTAQASASKPSHGSTPEKASVASSGSAGKRVSQVTRVASVSNQINGEERVALMQSPWERLLDMVTPDL